MAVYRRSLRFLFPPRSHYQLGVVDGHEHSILVPSKSDTDGRSARGIKRVIAEMKERTPHHAFASPSERAVHGHHALAPVEGNIDLLRRAHAETVCPRDCGSLGVAQGLQELEYRTRCFASRLRVR